VRGGFRPHDAAVTADTLQAFSIGLVPFSVYLYALRGFYALADTRTPFVINAIENVANVGLALALFPALGVQGLALAWTGAYSLAAILALVMLRRRVPGPVDAAVGATVVRAAIAGVALAIVASPLAAAIGRATANRALVASAAAALAGGIAYLLVLLALRTPELRSLFAGLRRAPTSLDV
jgi:putative peptidoglycan lipid II flippase